MPIDKYAPQGNLFHQLQVPLLNDEPLRMFHASPTSADISRLIVQFHEKIDNRKGIFSMKSDVSFYAVSQVRSLACVNEF